MNTSSNRDLGHFQVTANGKRTMRTATGAEVSYVGGRESVEFPEGRTEPDVEPDSERTAP